MRLVAFSSAEEFLGAAEPALVANEAANHLMYGLALRLQRYPERIKIAPYFAALYDDDGLAGAALMTPPHHLVVLASDATAGQDVYDALARDLRRGGWPVPGVVGPAAAALAFAKAWQRQTGRPYVLGVHERLYQLTQVLPPPPPGGRMRLARVEEEDLVANWLYEFHLEALPDEPTALSDHREAARIRLIDQDLYVWEDGMIVALAGHSRPTPHGMCIGPVYTPPRFRGRGYATALTAALSQRWLDAGKRFIVLFTNLANPTSNSIYQKIGYQAVCDLDLYRFG